MPGWSDRPPKGAKLKKRDWVQYDNGSFIAGTVRNWGVEEIYLMATSRAEKPLILAMTLHEAAAICSVLSTAMMVRMWDDAKKDWETIQEPYEEDSDE